VTIETPKPAEIEVSISVNIIKSHEVEDISRSPSKTMVTIVLSLTQNAKAPTAAATKCLGPYLQDYL